jgi:hypothetical protein
MQLRTKVTLIISAVILFSLGANYAIQQLLVAPSFRSLEESEALADWQRCLHNYSNWFRENGHYAPWHWQVTPIGPVPIPLWT